MKGPRWASTNLGIFLCQRCAGIHRSLGTHISKVKSIDLDYWTDDLVHTMAVIGNANAQRVYEWNVPANFPRPSREHPHVSTPVLEQWIRAKYERLEFANHELLKNIQNLNNVDAINIDVNIAGNSSPKSSSNVRSKTISSSSSQKSQSSSLQSSTKHSTQLLIQFNNDILLDEKFTPSKAPTNGVVVKNENNSKTLANDNSLLITDFVDLAGGTSNSPAATSPSMTSSFPMSSPTVKNASHTSSSKLDFETLTQPPTSNNNPSGESAAIINMPSLYVTSTRTPQQQMNRELSKQVIMQLYNQPPYPTASTLSYVAGSTTVFPYTLYPPSSSGTCPSFFCPVTQIMSPTTQSYLATASIPPVSSNHRLFQSM